MHPTAMVHSFIELPLSIVIQYLPLLNLC
uniref:Uncharacterized protein n=1 Tax=Arundo donax TaxID=35708 RepID=A0A0A9GJP8_ARUDO